MDQVVQKQIKPSRRLRPAPVGVAILSIWLVVGSSAVAQLLMSDNFDVGNTNGGAPGGWVLSQPSGTQILVTSNSATPFSSPYCVRLSDGSGSSRPTMYQSFYPASSGRASGWFKVNTTANAPAYLQLFTTNGIFLGALVLSSSGSAGYDNTGSGTVSAAVPWPSGSWVKLEIEWFDDQTFSGYLGTTQFVQRAAFATNASPGRVLLVVGDISGANRTGYVDNVQTVVTRPLVQDDFDTNNAFGNSPTNWVVTKPSGTNLRIVDSTVRTPASLPYCVEFSDNSSSSNPEMYTNFPATANGRVSYSVFVPATNQAPFYMHLRDTNGVFLTAVSLGTDGKIAYNANPAGSGPFIISSVAWTTNAWQTVRVDWFSNSTFSAFLGSNQFAANVAFGTNLVPGRALFRLADYTSTNRLAYLDDVLANCAVYPGAAVHTNNGVWLAMDYLVGARFYTNVPAVAFQMQTNYRVPYWFLNVGSLASNGVLPTGTERATNLLNRLNIWETQQGYKFKVLAMINGNYPPYGPLDITTPGVCSNIVLECLKLVSTNVAGSYVTKATRLFDGIQFDYEPAGGNAALFTSLTNLFDAIQAAFNAIGASNKLTSFTSPSCNTAGTTWNWTPDQYYAMGNHLDLLTAMTYDTAYTNVSRYQNWVQDQTTNILRAVSGKYWNNNGQHPAPTNGVQVMIGFPAFPNSGNHTNTVENISVAAAGTDAALNSLTARGDFSTNLFLGAAVYCLDDGSGDNGYSSWDSDWWMFGQYWLKTWNNFPPPPPPPLLVISPANLDYGVLALGQTNSLPFLVINNGGSTLTGTAGVGAPFAVTAGSGYLVGPSQTQTVTISFSPSSEGGFTNAAVFSSDGGNSTNPVSGLGAVAPQASFDVSPTNGVEPLLVSFNDTSTGTIDDRFWDFGDGATLDITTNATAHTYTEGVYTVSLIVTGPLGASTNTRPSVVTVWTALQAWQIQYFGSTTNDAALAGADPDGDGCNNLCEFLAGTDPTNSASGFRIISLLPQGSDLKLFWVAAGGRTNAVQATSDGGYTTNFSDISGALVIPGLGDATNSYVDGGAATNSPSRYYRIRLVP